MMNIDLSSSQTSARKRRAPHDSIDPTSDDDDDDDFKPQPETPSKRLQNSQGHPIPRDTLMLNTKKLLNHLASTRLFVTANFGNYNPSTSDVLLCIVGESVRAVHLDKR